MFSSTVEGNERKQKFNNDHLNRDSLDSFDSQHQLCNNNNNYYYFWKIANLTKKKIQAML